MHIHSDGLTNVLLHYYIMQLKIIIIRRGGQRIGELTYRSSSYDYDTWLKIPFAEIVHVAHSDGLAIGDHVLREVRGGFCNVRFRVGRIYTIHCTRV